MRHTIRKAEVNCPKCGHGFTVRDNGGLTEKQADQVWKETDRAFVHMDRMFAAFDRMFNAKRGR